MPISVRVFMYVYFVYDRHLLHVRIALSPTCVKHSPRYSAARDTQANSI